MTSADSSAADASQRGVLPAGTRLQKYELISVLGHDSFGITYRARDTQLDRPVAIKEYLPITLALREDGTMVMPRSTELAGEFVWGRDRFLDEARTLAKLGHAPAIVCVHDFLEANGTAYMVMAPVDGATLESRLKRDGSLPAAVIEKILPPLLDGLEQVHEAGFLHRDIKPANIVLDARDNPTLIDFGAARAASAGRSTAMPAIATPGYAAPRAVRVRPAGTGDRHLRPVGDALSRDRGQGAAERHRARDRGVRLGNPLSGADIVVAFAPGLLSGIDAGLALKANQRPQSIAEWRPLLTQAGVALAGNTVFKPPTTPAPAQPAVVATAAPAGGKSATRSLLLAGVAAVLLLVAGGGYYAVISVRAKQERQRVELEAQRKADEFAAQQKLAEEEERRAAADAAALARAQEQAAWLRAELEAKERADAEARAKAAASAAAAQNSASLRTSLNTIRTLMAQQGRIDYSDRGSRSGDRPDLDCHIQCRGEQSRRRRAGLPDQLSLAHGRQRQGRQGLRYGAAVSPGHQPYPDQHGRGHDAACDQGGAQHLGLERQPADLGGEPLRRRPQAIRGGLPRSGDGSVGRQYNEAGHEAVPLTAGSWRSCRR